MIDIIIPAYNAHDTIEKTLFSIAYQENVKDINVYIINDGSKKGYKEEVDYFKNFMNIKEISLKKNSGPGVARQKGIEISNSPYIIFIDADDVFASSTSIKILYDAITEGDYDLVVSNLEEEIDGKLEKKEHNALLLHGKIYKRKFLKENKIEFNQFRTCEDVSFNCLIYLNKVKMKYIGDVTYFWCNNKESITRRDGTNFFYIGIESYAYNNTWALVKAMENECSYERISNKVLAVLVLLYQSYIEFIDEKDVDKILLSAKRLKRIADLYPIINAETRKNLIVEQLLHEGSIDKILSETTLTFEKFLKKIDEI